MVLFQRPRRASPPTPHSSFMIRSLCRVSELGGAFYSETSHGLGGQSTREQGGCRRWVGWRWRHLLRAI